MRLKKGDKVVVLSGVDKGKQGKILMVLTDKNRVIVEGVNIIKRHSKPSQQNQAGGIIEKEAAVHVSKVAFVDPNTGEKSKLGVKVVDGKRVRYAKKSNEQV
jgi:large subunit ribosomal protein L24